METLKIEIPKGLEIDIFDQKTGTVKFKEKPKNIMERIKTVDDIFSDLGLSKSRFDKGCEDLSEDEKAYMLIKLLAKSLNQGWEPNWKNSNEYKYYPWFEMDSSSGFRFNVYGTWAATSSVGSRLCYKSRELAEYAGKQFEDLYRKFMVIN